MRQLYPILLSIAALSVILTTSIEVNAECNSTCCLEEDKQIDSNKNLEITHGPYLQNLKEREVTVMFSTDVEVIPGILISSDGENFELIKNSDGGLFNYGEGVHRVKISGLNPNTTYQYKVFAAEVVDYQPYKCIYGDTIISEISSFTTVNPEQKELNFTVICDTHDDAAKLNRYLDNNSIEDQDLYFLNGDILGHIDSEKQIYSSLIDPCVDRFAKSIPLFYVRGNHETRGEHARILKNYLSLDDNNYYYALSRGDVRFVVLDGGEDKPDSSESYSGLADFDKYRAEQLEWLKRELASSEFKEAAVKIVVIHMAIIDREDNWYGMEQLAKFYGPLLERAGIDLMISGHKHSNVWIDASESGFNYPVSICSNNDFTEVKIDGEKIDLTIKDQEGKVVDQHLIGID